MVSKMGIGSRLWNIVRHGTYVPVGCYVFDEKQVIYMPIPKTACTSIKISTMSDLVGSDEHNEYMNIHSDAEHYYHLSLNSRQRRYYKFAFVRSPFDRLVSCYEDKVKVPLQHNGRYFFDTPYNNVLLKTLFGEKFTKDMSFADFMRLVSKIPDFLSDAHFRSQYSILYKRGSLIPDYVGKFERLSDDWKPIADQFDFHPLALRNSSKRSDLEDYFNTPELLQLAAARYKDDIDCFGYIGQYEDLKRSAKA